MSEPATEATEAAAHGARKTGAAFGKKVGPFPLWAWGLIAGGVILAYHVLNSRSAPATSAQAADTTATDGLPDGTATATGAGPYGVTGFFVPVDAFGKAPTTPTPTPTHTPSTPATPSHPTPRLNRHIPNMTRQPPVPHMTHVPEQDTNEQELARKFFGSPTLWPLIHNANRGRIPTPGWIPAGTPVLIPRPH